MLWIHIFSIVHKNVNGTFETDLAFYLLIRKGEMADLVMQFAIFVQIFLTYIHIIFFSKLIFNLRYISSLVLLYNLMIVHILSDVSTCITYKIQYFTCISHLFFHEIKYWSTCASLWRTKQEQYLILVISCFYFLFPVWILHKYTSKLYHNVI